LATVPAKPRWPLVAFGEPTPWRPCRQSRDGLFLVGVGEPTPWRDVTPR
jgi:hypothetical protein